MFSETVDKALTRGGNRRDRLQDIIAFTQSSIREIQRLVPGFYRDRIEDEITVDALNANGAFIWSRPRNFRRFEAVEYPNNIHPKLIAPGKKQENEDEYYYGGHNYFAFVGVAVNEVIKLSYFSTARVFKYYTAAQRDTANPTTASQPAIYDRDAETWQYLNPAGTAYVSDLGSTLLNEAAENKVGNWVLLDYDNIVIEGALAKLYKIVGDQQRSMPTFALYKQLQNDIINGEPNESLDQ